MAHHIAVIIILRRLDEIEVKGFAHYAGPCRDPIRAWERSRKDHSSWHISTDAATRIRRRNEHGATGNPTGTAPPASAWEAWRERKKQLFPLACVESVQEEYR
jgi:hypothetical protein